MSWRFSCQLGMSEQATNVLLPTGGAGGLALGALVLYGSSLWRKACRTPSAGSDPCACPHPRFTGRHDDGAARSDDRHHLLLLFLLAGTNFRRGGRRDRAATRALHVARTADAPAARVRAREHTAAAARPRAPRAHERIEGVVPAPRTLVQRSDSPAASSVNGYVNPLAGASVTPERIDQGVDYSGSGPLGAIGRARITYIATSNTGWPGAFIEYQPTDGPDAGRHGTTRRA